MPTVGVITPRIGPWTGCGSRSWPSGPTCRSTRSASTKSASCSPAPAREGRVAWYGPEHLERLARIRELQAQGLTLALIGRVLSGDLDATDAPLAVAVADAEAPEEFLSLAELAERSGVPRGVARSRRARRAARAARSTTAPSATPRATSTSFAPGSSLLEAGFPLSDLLALAREHNDDDARHRRAGGRAVRSPRARTAARVGSVRRREGRTARRRVPHAAARGDRARRASLPARAARGRAGAPRVGRRRRTSSRRRASKRPAGSKARPSPGWPS